MSDSEEIWRHIKDFEGFYMVSNMGRIKSVDRSYVSSDGKAMKVNGRIRKPVCSRGYEYVSLTGEGVRKHRSIHRQVAIAFLPNPDNLREVNHKNGIKSDNRVENLEWCTTWENINHAHKSGLIRVYGSLSSVSKLNEEQILEIRSKYIPRIYTYKMLAKEYNVGSANIFKIVHRKRWDHI